MHLYYMMIYKLGTRFLHLKFTTLISQSKLYLIILLFIKICTAQNSIKKTFSFNFEF